MSELATQKKLLAPVAMTARGVNFQNMDDLARFCVAIVNSGLAPKGFSSPEAVMVAVQRGLEIGLPPLQALDSIAVINGRATLWGDAVLALVKGHPEYEDVHEEISPESVTCTVKRKGRSPVIRTFTVADAKRSRLWGKAGPWTDYPSRMLQMRARSWAIRDSFPDALRGIGIAEEVQDFNGGASSAQPKHVKLVLPDEAPLAIEQKAEPEAEATEAATDLVPEGREFKF